ncbi:leukocyte receptor cluster member [Salix suchowensis]|nr:leukocyte receptor cluster member [Salix suchowensis]
MMMMNQGVNAQTIASADPNSLEGRYIVDASQGKTSFIPSVNGSETASWTMHRVDNHSTDNGILSNPSYHHDQQTQQPARNAQDSLNTASLSCSSTQGTTCAVQDYSSYAAYNPTDPYGYGNSGYSTSYYNNGYQQQTNNHSYSQQQPNHSYSQQQPSHSYSSTVGSYQNTGAPYQPLSSFQNTGSYTGTTSYSTTYYNPGDYQTAGGYPSSGYNNQTPLWNDPSYANYTSQQYSTYAPDTTSAYSSSTAASTSMNNEQHYKQWADYYSQTEVICAPGTEHLSAASKTNQGSAMSGVYPTYSTQPTSSFTPASWRTESASSDLPSFQTSATISTDHDGWKQGVPSFQNHHASPMQPHFQYSLDSKASYDNFQDQQQQTAPQGPNSQFPAAHQVTQSYQSPLPNAPSLDTRRVNMMQIPTNPRIASNLALGLSKTDKDGSTTDAAAKPAYISVSMPKPNNKVLSNDTTISMLKPGKFPNSLCRYVERAFNLCKDETQRVACQAIMKEIITKATANGTLNTLDWDVEPLFSIPNSEAVNVESSQYSSPVSSLPKYKRSPSRRSKSRWEPLPEEKSVDKSVSISNDIVQYGGWARKAPSANSESKENPVNNVKFSLLEQKLPSKNNQRPAKRQHLADGLNAANNDASSDSDKEQSLTAYYSSAKSIANTPEEKKRRESRSKRFEKGQGYRTEVNYFKPKNAGAGNLYSRRARALMLSKSLDDSGSKAVEDFDWDALTVKGTCQEIEKRYLRLTSAPDPSTVRPEEVLEKALLMVHNSQKNYLYRCDQLKSIRQDLTVQRIQNQLTVKVYETHARLALEAGDLPEYNQCQSQLKTLYAEGIEGCHMEFAAYNLLCVILHSNNNRDLVSSMSRLNEGTKKDKAVKHALAVRAAVTSGNYVMFFRLYKEAPNLNTCLMDLYVEKMRYRAVTCMSRSYRPTIPVSYIAQVLGFSSTSGGNDEKDSDGSGLEECVEWMKAHGACLTTDNSGEMQLDTKASSSSLYMPEPEDAVAHGDANLAVNDFLTRTPL